MFVQALAYGIKEATLSGKEKVGTRVVGKLKVKRISSDSLPSKFNSCDQILALAPSRFNILMQINFWHHVIPEPGVHDEVSLTGLFNQTDNRVRVGHSS